MRTRLMLSTAVQPLLTRSDDTGVSTTGDGNSDPPETARERPNTGVTDQMVKARLSALRRGKEPIRYQINSVAASRYIRESGGVAELSSGFMNIPIELVPTLGNPKPVVGLLVK